MLVHHAGHSVKAESVEVIFVHPEAKVRQEETLDFWMAIIEQARIPEIVSASAALMEVKMIRSIKHVEAVDLAVF